MERIKNPKKVKKGKISKAQGDTFERRVRTSLESKGWIVNRCSNNVDLKEGKLIPAKVTWRKTPHGMFPMNLNPGLPDFIAFKLRFNNDVVSGYEIIGVESKMTGELDKEEKLKCRWLLDNNVFSKILIASKHKVKNRIVVEYENFIEIEKRMKR